MNWIIIIKTLLYLTNAGHVKKNDRYGVRMQTELHNNENPERYGLQT